MQPGTPSRCWYFTPPTFRSRINRFGATAAFVARLSRVAGLDSAIRSPPVTAERLKLGSVLRSALAHPLQMLHIPADCRTADPQPTGQFGPAPPLETHFPQECSDLLQSQDRQLLTMPVVASSAAGPLVGVLSSRCDVPGGGRHKRATILRCLIVRNPSRPAYAETYLPGSSASRPELKECPPLRHFRTLTGKQTHQEDPQGGGRRRTCFTSGPHQPASGLRDSASSASLRASSASRRM